jgi:hypothetical protein
MADYPTRRQLGIYTRAHEKSTTTVRRRRYSPAADDGRWGRTATPTLTLTPRAQQDGGSALTDVSVHVPYAPARALARARERAAHAAPSPRPPVASVGGMGHRSGWRASGRRESTPRGGA